MGTEQRIHLIGTIIRFDSQAGEMVVTQETAQGDTIHPTKKISVSEWWDAFMQDPFTFGSGPWHFAKGSVAAKLSSGADVNAEGAEMEFGLARKPILEALRFAIEENISQIEIFKKMDQAAQQMKQDKGIKWAPLYADALKVEFNNLRGEIEIEKSSPDQP